MNFNLLEQSIGHKFSNYEVLSEALTHRSYSNEDERNKKNYERLELLGDAVLELAITDILMNKYPDSSEGELSKARSALVKAGILAKVARSIELGNYVKLGKGEDLSGGRDRDSILSCAMEALLGAVYIDAGFERSQMVVAKLWGHIVDMVFSEEYDVDYKTKLQELMQSRYRVLPAYSVVNISGPSHNRVFKVMVSAGDINQTGLGKNKKEAAQKAASMALKAMQEETRI